MIESLSRLSFALCAILLAVGLVVAPVAAQEEPPPDPPAPDEEPQSPPENGKGDTDENASNANGKKAKKNGKDDKGPKPYDEVITEKMTTDTGLFTVHRDGDDVYFEIPPSELDQEMVWVTQIAGTQAGFSWAGMPVGDRVVRWEQRGDRVLLRDVKYDIRADVDDPIRLAVEATTVAPIIHVFDVAAYGKDKAPVIEVAKFFASDPTEFSASESLGAKGIDAKRTMIEEIKSFPINIETKVLATYNLERPRPGGERDEPGPGFPSAIPRDPTQSGVTVLLHHSMVKLPEEPMAPRLFDDRVGYFSVGFTDFGDDSNHEAKRVQYITRWRLEKKHPKKKLSEPVQPIVWYVGREVPEKFRQACLDGIEAWQPAFEAAGFKNAIVGKLAPTAKEDPDWASPSDPRAQKLPLPDELMAELVTFVVAHEVGHSLGFPHNMKASSSYSIEQLRDPEFTAKMGTAPSIMDYARFNYVAQPEDGASLTPAIGVYDLFAAEWGYREFPAGADEIAELETIVARQKDDPMLRFGPPNPSEDPTQQTEDLGANAVEATRLGLANLERVAGYLIEATSRPGEDYDLLENMHGALIGQWQREMGHVANVVGGVERINLRYGDADRRFFPIDAGKQREAVAFLNENAFTTPALFLDPDVLGRLEASGVAERVLAAQSDVLRALIDERRIKRMNEIAAAGDDDVYAAADMIADVTAGIWSELENSSGGKPAIDLYRRNLQRAYIDVLVRGLDSNEPSSDLPALARGQLTDLASKCASLASAGADVATTRHLEDIAARIRLGLDKVKVEKDPPAQGGGRPRRGIEAF